MRETDPIADRCPKRMTHGPCGGVRPDGSCEIGGRCEFVDRAGPQRISTAGSTGLGPLGSPVPATVVAAAPTGRALGVASRALLARLLDPAATRPFVIADLPSPGPGPELEHRLGGQLAGRVDAVLLGDAPWARVQLPPSVRGRIAIEEGLTPWSGLNARDRNRVALESELHGLQATGVAAVHVVTGDHPELGHRPDAAGVFDLDSTDLAALASRGTGLVISAAESPLAPPTAARAARAAAKHAAGVDVLFVNHCAPEELEAFAAELAQLAPAMPLIACIPLVLSRTGADRVAHYLHAAPPPDLVAALDEPDPLAAAVAGAIRHAERVAAIPGVVGIDLSAPAGPGEELDVARALALTGRALGVE
ncbi:MAG: methylenetetrahydrofolate reductase C-terminal domain-containing protein [Patulibacter minatonensis]